MGMDRFFSNSGAKYNGYQGNTLFQKMYSWLSDPQNIMSMIKACKQSKPALEGVIEEFVDEFGSQTMIPLSKTFNRQMIGAMVKEIMWDYGYLQTENARFSRQTKGAPFSSGMQYRFYEDYQTKTLVVKVEEKQLKEPISMDKSVWNLKNIQNDLNKKNNM